MMTSQTRKTYAPSSGPSDSHGDPQSDPFANYLGHSYAQQAALLWANAAAVAAAASSTAPSSPSCPPESMMMNSRNPRNSSGPTGPSQVGTNKFDVPPTENNLSYVPKQSQRPGVTQKSGPDDKCSIPSTSGYTHNSASGTRTDPATLMMCNLMASSAHENRLNDFPYGLSSLGQVDPTLFNQQPTGSRKTESKHASELECSTNTCAETVRINQFLQSLASGSPNPYQNSTKQQQQQQQQQQAALLLAAALSREAGLAGFPPVYSDAFTPISMDRGLPSGAGASGRVDCIPVSSSSSLASGSATNLAYAQAMMMAMAAACGGMKSPTGPSGVQPMPPLSTSSGLSNYDLFPFGPFGPAPTNSTSHTTTGREPAESFSDVLSFLTRCLNTPKSANDRMSGNPPAGIEAKMAPTNRRNPRGASNSRSRATNGVPPCSTVASWEQPATGIATRHRGRGRPPKSTTISIPYSSHLKQPANQGATPTQTGLMDDSDLCLHQSYEPATTPRGAHRSSGTVNSVESSIEETIDEVLRQLAACDYDPAVVAAKHASGPLGMALSRKRRKESRSMLTELCDGMSSGGHADMTGAQGEQGDNHGSHGMKRSRAESGLRLPLALGWRRETLVKGIGPGGILGEVIYVSPCGRRLWNLDSVREYLQSKSNNNESMLSVDDFSFKSYIRLGDYYECSRTSQSPQSYVKMSESALDSLTSAAGMAETIDPPRSCVWPTPTCADGQTDSYPSASEMISSRSTGRGTSTGQSSGPMLPPAAHSHPVTPQKSTFQFSSGLFDLTNNEPNSVNYLTPGLNLESIVAPPVAHNGNDYATSKTSMPPLSPLDSGFPSSMNKPLIPLTPHGSVVGSAGLPLAENPWSPLKRPGHQINPAPFLPGTFSVTGLDPTLERDFMKHFFIELANEHLRLDREKRKQRQSVLLEEREQLLAKCVKERVEHELKKPVDDMRLLNCKPLPDLEPIRGNRLSGQAFADSLLVIEFLHAFTEILCIDSETIPTLGMIQAALVDRDPDCQQAVLHLLVELLKFAILDPGLPSSRLVTQLLGQRFSELEVNAATVTGLLRVFLIGRNGFEDEMSDWLVPPCHFTDLSGDQQAALLAFVCDELVCSSRLISTEVDRTIELQAVLKREKWVLESKIRRLKFLVNRKFGTGSFIDCCSTEARGSKTTLDTAGHSLELHRSTSLHDDCGLSPGPRSEDNNETLTKRTCTVTSKPQAERSSFCYDESVDNHEISEKPLCGFSSGSAAPNASATAAAAVSAAAVANAFLSGDEEETDDAVQLEAKIETLNQLVGFKQRAIDECAYRLSGLFLGQDRYYRRYYALGHVGGIYVQEGQVSTFDSHLEMCEKDQPDMNDLRFGFDPDHLVAEIERRRCLADRRRYTIAIPNGSVNSHQPANHSSTGDGPPQQTCIDKPGESAAASHADFELPEDEVMSRDHNGFAKVEDTECSQAVQCASSEKDTKMDFTPEVLENGLQKVTADEPKLGSLSTDSKCCLSPDEKASDVINGISTTDDQLTAPTDESQVNSAFNMAKLSDISEQPVTCPENPSCSETDEWNKQSTTEAESSIKQGSAHSPFKSNMSLDDSSLEKPAFTSLTTKSDHVADRPDPYLYNFDSSPSVDGEEDKEGKIAPSEVINFKVDGSRAENCTHSRFTPETKDYGTPHELEQDPAGRSPKIEQPKEAPSGEETFGSSQPLDLSTRANGDAGANAKTCEDLLPLAYRTLENGSELLEKLGFDDVLLTTAALLFMTHTAIIPASVACSESLSDPWKSIISHYKSVLTWGLLDEITNTKNSNEEQPHYDPKLLHSTEITSTSHPLRESVLVLKGFFLRDLSGSKCAGMGVPDPGAGDGEHVTPISDNEVEELATQELQLRNIQLPPESPLSLPASKPSQWCSITHPVQVADLLTSLSPRGIRERNLSKCIKRSEEFVYQSLQVASKLISNLENPSKTNDNAPRYLRVRSRRGKGRGNNASNAQLYSSLNRTESCVQPVEPNQACEPMGLSEIGLGGWSNAEPTCPFPVNETYGLEGGEDPASVCSENAGGDLNPPLVLEHRLRRRPQNKSEHAGSVAERLEKRPGVSGFKVQALQNNGRSLHEVMGSGDPVFVAECCFLEEVEALEDRVLHASLQVKGWQAPVKVLDDETIHLLPRTTSKRSRFEHWPLDLARIRLLGLESHLERRYLLPPLNSEVHLDVVPETESALATDSSRVLADLTDPETESESGFGGGPGSESTNTSLRDGDSGHANATHHQQPVIRRIVGKPLQSGQELGMPSVSHSITGYHQTSDLRDSMGGVHWHGNLGAEQVPPGLQEWRHRLHRASDLDAMRACMDELISAIAWDKSIMKVLCQICRRDNNEAQLLLCDGCDHGYHTYCFRPPLTNIPPGDWFCNDCVAKATGKPICFVCGSASTQPSSTGPNLSADSTQRLFTCEKCTRSMHAQCARPPMSRIPRRWLCANCHTGTTKMGKGTSAPSADSVTSPTSCPIGRTLKKADNTIETDMSVPNKDPKKKSGHSAIDATQPPPHRFPSDPKIVKAKRLNKTRPVGTTLLNKLKHHQQQQQKQQSKRRANLAKHQSQPRTGQRGVDHKSNVHRRGRPTLFGRTPTLHSRANSEKQRMEPGKSQASEDDVFSACSSPACSQMTSSGSDVDHAQRQPLSQSQMEWIRTATEDLIKHEASWAFRKPVNVKQIPFYRKIIKHPMDLSTIHRKTGRPCAYSTIEQWQKDVRLIFNNCEIFNEDDSDVGRAGHTMRAYFESRWSTPPMTVDADSMEQVNNFPDPNGNPQQDHQEQPHSLPSSPSDCSTSFLGRSTPKPESDGGMPLRGESSHYDQDSKLIDLPSPVHSVDSDSRSSGFSGFEQNEFTLDLPLNNSTSPGPNATGTVPVCKPVPVTNITTTPSEACLPATSSPLQ